MADELSAFGATGGAKPKSSGGSGTSTPTVSVDRPPVQVLEFLMTAVDEFGGLAEYPVLASNAVAVSDLVEATDDEEVLGLLQGLDEAGVETLSLEDFFNVDLEGRGIEFVGTPPLLNETDRGEFSELDDDTKDLYADDDIYSYGDPDNGLKAYIVEPDWLDVVHEGRYDDSVINMVNYALNGHYFPEIREHVDAEEPTRFKVQIGRNHNHQGEDGEVDEFSKRRSVAFSFESSGTTDKRIISAARNVGNISPEDVEDYSAGEVDLDDIAELVAENRD